MNDKGKNPPLQEVPKDQWPAIAELLNGRASEQWLPDQYVRIDDSGSGRYFYIHIDALSKSNVKVPDLDCALLIHVHLKEPWTLPMTPVCIADILSELDSTRHHAGSVIAMARATGPAGRYLQSPQASAESIFKTLERQIQAVQIFARNLSADDIAAVYCDVRRSPTAPGVDE